MLLLTWCFHCLNGIDLGIEHCFPQYLSWSTHGSICNVWTCYRRIYNRDIWAKKRFKFIKWKKNTHTSKKRYQYSAFILLVHYSLNFEIALFLLLLTKATIYLNRKYFIITEVFNFFIFVFRRVVTKFLVANSRAFSCMWTLKCKCKTGKIAPLEISCKDHNCVRICDSFHSGLISSFLWVLPAAIRMGISVCFLCRTVGCVTPTSLVHVAFPYMGAFYYAWYHVGALYMGFGLKMRVSGCKEKDDQIVIAFMWHLIKRSC